MSGAKTDGRPHPRGRAVLDDPAANKGPAFTADERRTLGLEGLLPPTFEDIDRQVERVLGHLAAKPTDLERSAIDAAFAAAVPVSSTNGDRPQRSAHAGHDARARQRIQV